MKELNGLWKNDNLGLLLQLHGAAVPEYKTKRTGADSLVRMKAVARVVKGRMQENIDLIPVLPKHAAILKLIFVSELGRGMWAVECVVILEKSFKDAISGWPTVGYSHIMPTNYGGINK